MRFCLTLMLVCAAVATPRASSAQVLSFRDGTVTIRADRAPFAAVLAEWARAGQTEIPGLDRLIGPPVSLTLDDVPEAVLLERLLSTMAGFVVVPRKVRTSATQSSYERILILPASAASSAASAPGPSAESWPLPMNIEPDSSTVVDVTAETGAVRTALKEEHKAWPLPMNLSADPPPVKPGKPAPPEQPNVWPLPMNTSDPDEPERPALAAVAPADPQNPGPWPLPMNLDVDTVDDDAERVAAAVAEDGTIIAANLAFIRDPRPIMRLSAVPGARLGLEPPPGRR